MSIATLSKQELTKEQLFTYLAALHETFDEANDETNVEKINQLVTKLKENEFTIGFCGHFSAGKSSMMNYLMKENILPSSPIPTSANVVKVKKGRSYARVFYKKEEPIEFPAPYDYEVVKAYCKDGDSIMSLEISEESINLPEGIAILDTPGIDSTDDAHRLATESALHLADMVFYVMDYNHVQSEQNFMFTKELKDRKKPVYLVINMIDKHNENELSFAAFKHSVKQSFSSWNVEPDGIFYTSLRDKSLPINELEQLEQFLTAQMEDKDQLLIDSIYNSCQQLIEDHLLFMKKKQEETLAVSDSIKALSEADRLQLIETITALNNQKDEHEKYKEIFNRQFEEELKNLLDNAYIMPAETRELARSYLESVQADFKVGFLFGSKKKTEEERQKRLTAFYENLLKQVETQVIWHMKDFLAAMMKTHGIDDDGLQQEIYEWDVTFSKQLLQEQVKTGAIVTGDYVLNYTNDVTNAIKRLYQREARKFIEKAKKVMQQSAQQQLRDLEEQLTKFKQYAKMAAQMEAQTEEYKNYEKELKLLLTGAIDPSLKERADKWLKEALAKSEPQYKIQTMEEIRHVINVAEQTIIEDEAKQKRDEIDTEQLAQTTIGQLMKASQLLDGIKGFKMITTDLVERAENLKNRSFTVALFGAFSAGKSSFANALIGAKLLPVSPNPTTATINKIAPPTLENAHGTVKIMLKSKQVMFQDLKESLQVFNIDCISLEEALDKIEKLTYDGENAREKPHYSFLKAASRGYRSIKEKLGSEIIVDLIQFQEYVAKEDKACFVEWIELYYDCPLTQSGITLVDTPGADSINARHTEVAFEYIKNADAVLFVTYYNHAFSNADREFLIQLGRVKETFEMDKMFFIVNASDLASSNEELQYVIAYLNDQLISYGIRAPRIYPMSSKLALEGKTANDAALLKKSNIIKFEADFKSFIIDELIEMAVASAQEQMKQSARMLDELLTVAKQTPEQKQQQKLLEEKEKEELLRQLQHLKTDTLEKAVVQEIEELVYYVNQRIFLRFSDFYTESFHPAKLQDRNSKQMLKECVKDLLDRLGFDLSQEMRATSLRLEMFINRKLQQLHVATQQDLNKINEHLHFISFKAKELEKMEFEKALTALSPDNFKTTLSLFKNPKSFFEQGGKEKMREKLQEELQQPVQAYLNAQKEKLVHIILQHAKQSFHDLIEQMESDIEEYYVGVFEVLSETIDTSKMEKAKIELNAFFK